MPDNYQMMTPERTDADTTQGHEERFARQVPELWSTMSRAHPAAWGLPSATITVFSMLTFVTVLGLLTLPPSRHQTFRLPDHGVLGFLAAAGMAALITLIGSRRPGPTFPRAWALGLTLASFGGAALTVIGALGRGLYPAALGVSAFAAAVVLLARLVPISPRSSLLRRMAPVTALLVLLGIIPTSMSIQSYYEEADRGRVRALQTELESLTAAVSELSKFNAGDLHERATTQSTAQTAADVLDAIALPVDFQRRMDAAVVAARGVDRQAGEGSTTERDLVTAYTELLAAIQTQALRPDGGWTSAAISLTPPTRYQRGKPGWDLDAASATLPAKVYRFQFALSKVLSAVQYAPSPAGAEAPAWAEAAERISQVGLRTTFANGWASNPDMQLSDLLRAPVVAESGEAPPVRLSDLGGMFSLSAGSARALVGPRSGCRWVDGIPSQAGTVEWLECFGYRPAPDAATSAELTIVYRLIYVEGSRTPEQLYVLLLPTGTDSGAAVVDTTLRAWAGVVAAAGWRVDTLTASERQDASYRTGFCAAGGDPAVSYQARLIRDADNTWVRSEGTGRRGLVLQFTPSQSCPPR